jgi:hypothetical protein
MGKNMPPVCHSERSEESVRAWSKILRSAQHDNWRLIYAFVYWEWRMGH